MTSLSFPLSSLLLEAMCYCETLEGEEDQGRLLLEMVAVVVEVPLYLRLCSGQLVELEVAGVEEQFR